MKRGILYGGLILSLIVLLIFAYAIIFEYDLEVRPSIWYATVKDIFEQGDKSDIIMNSPPLDYNNRREIWSNMEGITLLISFFVLLFGIIIDMDKNYKKYCNDRYSSITSFCTFEFMVLICIGIFLSDRSRAYMGLLFPTYIAMNVFIKILWILFSQRKESSKDALRVEVI